MNTINDFNALLNRRLSYVDFVRQCLIKDYVYDKDKKYATCTCIVPNYNGEDTCEISQVIALTTNTSQIKWQDYMHGLLIKMQTPYATAEQINQKKPADRLGYWNIARECYFAMIVPTDEVLSNITHNITKASEQIDIVAPKVYVGNESTNVLNEICKYLKELKTFFDEFKQNAPTIALQPNTGASKMVVASTQAGQKTQELYDKITEIVNTEATKDE